MTDSSPLLRTILLCLAAFSLLAAGDAPKHRAEAADPPALARLNSLFSQGAFPAAIKGYKAELENCLSQKQHRAFLRLSLRLSDSLQAYRQFDLAAPVLDRILTRAAGFPNSRKDTLLALLHHRQGVNYFSRWDYEAAAGEFKASLAIRERVWDRSHPIILQLYHNIGAAYMEIGQHEQALHYLLESLRRQPKSPTPLMPWTLGNLGRVYKDLGDSYQAERYFLQMLAYYQKNHPEAHREMAEAHLKVSAFYVDRYHYPKGIAQARSALALLRQLPERDFLDSLTMARCYNNIGAGYEMQDSLLQARRHLDSAVAINRLFPGESDYDLALNFNNLGIVCRKLGRFEDARRYQEASAGIHQRLGDQSNLANNYHNLGEILYYEGRPREALNWHRKSLCLLSPALCKAQANAPYLAPEPQTFFGDRLQLMTYLAAQGKTMRQLYRQTGESSYLYAALDLFGRLDTLVDLVRLSYLADDSKINLEERTKPLLSSAIDVCLDLYGLSRDRRHLERAFAFSEKGKAIVLLEAIKRSRAAQFGLPAEALKQEREIRRNIADCESRLFKEQNQEQPNPAVLQELNAELLGWHNRYQAFTQELAVQSPEYFQLKYDQRSISVDRLQKDPQLLAPDQALVEFFIGVEHLYVFTISRSDFRADTLPLDFPLQTWVTEFREAILGLGKQPEAFMGAYLQRGLQLYQHLLAPLAPHLPKRLIIVPDEALGLLPFEALLTSASDSLGKRDFRRLPYLLRERQISYCYSASLLAEMKQPARSAPRNRILAFAPSFGSKESGQKNSGSRGQMNVPAQRGLADVRQGGLSPLFFNRAEVESISRLAATRICTGREAHKRRFLSDAPNYRFLHFATHGIADSDHPDFSFIAFSQEGDTVATEELLFVRELYDLHLPADLVVLSACETAVGPVARGEGIVSLARGFSYAGARSLVTTLWNISDQQSNVLVEGFYRHLREGHPKDEALRLAKLDYIAQHPALAQPYYWAAFISIGDMAPVALPEPSSAQAWIWVLVGITAALVVIWRFRRRLTTPAHNAKPKSQLA